LRKIVAFAITLTMVLGSFSSVFAMGRTNDVMQPERGISAEAARREMPVMEDAVDTANIADFGAQAIDMTGFEGNRAASMGNVQALDDASMTLSANAQRSVEAQFVYDAAHFLLETENYIVMEGLENVADNDTVRIMVWLQQLPLAARTHFDANHLYVAGLDAAEARSNAARNTINVMPDVTVLGEFWGIFAGFGLETTMATARKIAALPGVHAVTKEATFYLPPVEHIAFPDFIPDPNFEIPGNAAGRRVGGVDQLHTMGVTGDGVIIAILDDGIFMDHPDFSNLGGGYNFAGRTTNLFTGPNTHGTHVAGTAGSTGEAGGSLGVAPGATILNGMVFGVGQSGASTTDINAALEVFSGFMPAGNWPGLAGLNLPKADVINMSLGNSVQSEYNQGNWERNMAVLAGVSLAASAGNNANSFGGRATRTVFSGAAALTISVAGTQYGSAAWPAYHHATLNGELFPFFVESVDAMGFPSAYINDGEFGNPVPHSVTFHAGNTGTAPNIWLPSQWHGTYNRQPLNWTIDGVQVHWVNATQANPLLDSTAAVTLPALQAIPTDSLQGQILIINRGIDFTDMLGHALRTGAGGVMVLNRYPHAVGNMLIARCPIENMVVLTAGVGARQVLLDAFNIGNPMFIDPGVLGLQEQLPEPAQWSSIGPTMNHAFMKPDITAPAWEIFSTTVDVTGTVPTWGLMGGTSMSSPYIAGVAALIIQYQRDFHGNNPTPAEVRARIMASADPFLIQPIHGAVGISNPRGFMNAAATYSSVWEQGAGFVNPYRAITETPFFLLEHNFPQNLAAQPHLTADFSSLSFGRVPVNGVRTLNVRAYGIDNFTLDVVYMVGAQATRYSNPNAGHVTVTTTPTALGFDVTLAVNSNAVNVHAQGSYYEGYIRVTDTDTGFVYYVPWAVQAFGVTTPPGPINSVPISLNPMGGMAQPATYTAVTNVNGAITWAPAAPTFQWENDYTATIVLTGTNGFWLHAGTTITVPNAESFTYTYAAGQITVIAEFELGEQPEGALVTIVDHRTPPAVEILSVFAVDTTGTVIDIWEGGGNIGLFTEFCYRLPTLTNDGSGNLITAELLTTGSSYTKLITPGAHDWMWWNWNQTAFGFQGPFITWNTYTFSAGGAYLVEKHSGGIGGHNQGVITITPLIETLSTFTVNRETMWAQGGEWIATATGYFPVGIEYEIHHNGNVIQSGMMDGVNDMTRTATFNVPVNNTGVDQIFEIYLPDWGQTRTLVQSHEEMQAAIITVNVPENVWNDQSGYQMWIEADGGGVLPAIRAARGPFPASAIPPIWGQSFPQFLNTMEYWVPANATPTTTGARIITGSESIEVEAGIYNFVFANPEPGGQFWLVGENNMETSGGPSIQNPTIGFEFHAGFEYIFTVSRNIIPGDWNDQVHLQIVPLGAFEIDEINLDITAPVANATPQTTVTGSLYEGDIVWSPNHTPFQWDNIYAATITVESTFALGTFAGNVTVNVPGADNVIIMSVTPTEVVVMAIFPNTGVHPGYVTLVAINNSLATAPRNMVGIDTSNSIYDLWHAGESINIQFDFDYHINPWVSIDASQFGATGNAVVPAGFNDLSWWVWGGQASLLIPFVTQFYFEAGYVYHIYLDDCGIGHWNHDSGDFRIERQQPRVDGLTVNTNLLPMAGGVWEITLSGVLTEPDEYYEYQIWDNWGDLVQAGFLTGTQAERSTTFNAAPNFTGVSTFYTITLENFPYTEFVEVSPDHAVPAGFAMVTFEIGNPWNDGSGHIMLLDSTNSPIPTTGIPFANFDFHIPTNANATPINVVPINTSYTIMVPAGTFSFLEGNIWSASMFGRTAVHNFEFEDGYHYHFRRVGSAAGFSGVWNGIGAVPTTLHLVGEPQGPPTEPMSRVNFGVYNDIGGIVEAFILADAFGTPETAIAQVNSGDLVPQDAYLLLVATPDLGYAFYNWHWGWEYLLGFDPAEPAMEWLWTSVPFDIIVAAEFEAVDLEIRVVIEPNEDPNYVEIEQGGMQLFNALVGDRFGQTWPNNVNVIWGITPFTPGVSVNALGEVAVATTVPVGTTFEVTATVICTVTFAVGQDAVWVEVVQGYVQVYFGVYNPTGAFGTGIGGDVYITVNGGAPITTSPATVEIGSNVVFGGTADPGFAFVTWHMGFGTPMTAIPTFTVSNIQVTTHAEAEFVAETRVATYIYIDPVVGTIIRGQTLQMGYDLLDQVGDVFAGPVVWTVTTHQGVSINATGLLNAAFNSVTGTVITVRVAYANDLDLYAEALITVVDAPVPSFQVFFNANPLHGAVVTAALADGTPVAYGQSVPRGTRVTFTATMNAGFNFVRWSSMFGAAALGSDLIITDAFVPFNTPAVHTTTLPINSDTRVVANVVAAP